MTALNIVIAADRAFVLTDTACYDHSYKVQSFRRKAEAVAKGSLRVIIALRGDWSLLEMFADGMLGWYGDMDELLADEGRKIEEAHRKALKDYDLMTPHAEFFVVGWSDAKASPVGIVLAVGGERRIEVIEDGVASPFPKGRALNELQLQKAQPGVDWTSETFDPHKHGIPLLEAQRRMGLPAKGLKGVGYVVGGDVHLTTLTVDGVEQEIIHGWDGDQAGELIQPAAFVPPAIEAGNRQQRRAAERLAKKLSRRAA